MKMRVASIWRSAVALWVRVSGTWRQVRYQYVRVGGTWRLTYRAVNAMYDGSITMGYVNYAGVDNWGYSAGNYGSASPNTLKDGSTLQLVQIANDTRGAYGPRRWLQIAVPGNVPSVDISTAQFAGYTSVEVISVNYVAAFNLTEILLGFGVQLPTTGTHNLKL